MSDGWVSWAIRSHVACNITCNTESRVPWIVSAVKHTAVRLLGVWVGTWLGDCARPFGVVGMAVCAHRIVVLQRGPPSAARQIREWAIACVGGGVLTFWLVRPVLPLIGSITTSSMVMAVLVCNLRVPSDVTNTLWQRPWWGIAFAFCRGLDGQNDVGLVQAVIAHAIPPCWANVSQWMWLVWSGAAWSVPIEYYWVAQILLLRRALTINEACLV